MSSSASASGGNAVFRNGQTGSWETWQWNGAGKSGVCGNAELLDWMKRAEVWCASIHDVVRVNLSRQHQWLSNSGLDPLCAVLHKTEEERTSLQAEVPKAGLGESELWKCSSVTREVGVIEAVLLVAEAEMSANPCEVLKPRNFYPIGGGTRGGRSRPRFEKKADQGGGKQFAGQKQQTAGAKEELRRSARNSVCNRCLQKGHIRADCTQSEPTCRGCGVVGHIGANCPAKG
jgi:hypothetical protein